MIKSWLNDFQVDKTPKKVASPTGYAYLIGSDDPRLLDSIIDEHSLDWQLDSLRRKEREVIYLSGKKGPVWILKPKEPKNQGHWGIMSESPYTWARDTAGSLFGFFKAHQLKSVVFEFIHSDRDQELGALIGLDLAAYNFRDTFENRKFERPQVYLKKSRGSFDKNLLLEASQKSRAINVARHLVNLPPNEINPTRFVNYLKTLKWGTNTKIEVWNTARLKKEKCGLIMAVGNGSETPPCLVHIRYRPPGKTGSPVAFVGKGITFDTGGLDIKPSSAMRLMKKDMGGAAAVAALAYWVSQSKISTPCDFYLALAENSVDGKSFRPSDVIVSRAGHRVEIDNTDAEGRLVLADALDVAVTQKGAHEPDTVINVATLTGAIKVALGTKYAGLFCNDDALADSLLESARKRGDYAWRMPLVEEYFASLNSPFADFKNCGESFGGSITAALFLQRFVRGKKWAHLDIYAWADKASGALASAGGSGQAVQCLIDYLESGR